MLCIHGDQSEQLARNFAKIIYILENLEFRKIDITCHKFRIDINIGDIKAFDILRLDQWIGEVLAGR